MVNISIVVIVDKIRPTLDRLFNSMKNQLNSDIEVLLIHETKDYVELPKYSIDIKYFPIRPKQGFSYNRNKGIEYSKGNIIVYVDDDIWVHDNWLESLLQPLFEDENLLAVTSGTHIPKSNLVGDSISALGFPGGGSLGFDKVWKVDSNKMTNHICVGNCALRMIIFSKIGKFDESMKSGAEDAEFSFRMQKANIPVKYVKEAFAYHEARDSLSSFIKWQIRRGKANYQFKQKVGAVGGFIKLRIWSAKNIFKKNITNWKLPFIFFLLGFSFFLQQIGFFMEKYKN